MSRQTETVHGSTVAIGRHGVMFQGRSGSGKSDIALRLIDSGARLVADDQTILSRQDGRLFAKAPPQLSGLIEVRGIGILKLPALARTPLSLVVMLNPKGEIERLPEPKMAEFLGVKVPLIEIMAFEASAVAKLRLALKQYTDNVP
jgi:serine kinase of HPr protein (carbohydrate metabolism regulator)